MSRFYLTELITLIRGQRIINQANKNIQILGYVETDYNVDNANLLLKQSYDKLAVPFFPSLTTSPDANKFGLVAGVFIWCGPKCLVINRSSNSSTYSNRLSIPAGYVENGESLIDGCRRETLEEVGIDLHDCELELACVIESTPKNDIHNVFMAFETTIDQQVLPRVDTSEVGYAEYMTIQEILKNDTRFPPGVFTYLKSQRFQKSLFQ